MTIVAGGQQAPRKCCLSSSTGRVRGSRAFGSRSIFQPDDHARTNLKNQRDIRSEIGIHGKMRSHAASGRNGTAGMAAAKICGRETIPPSPFPLLPFRIEAKQGR
jgi:hypothetical protein